MAALTKRWTLATLVLGLTACGNGDPVVLGREQLRKEDAPSCDDACEDATVLAGDGSAATSPFVPAAAPCDGAPVGQLAISLHVTEETERLCADRGPCQLELSALSPSADGSAWVLGALAGLAPQNTGMWKYRIWLAHFAADGSRLGEWLGDDGYNLAFAVDDRGQAWLLNQVGASTTLLRFSDRVAPIGAALPVPGGLSIASQPAHGVLLLSSDALTLYDYDGKVVRTQSTSEQNPPNSLIARADGITLLSTVAREGTRSRKLPIGAVVLDDRNADGVERWRTTTTVSYNGWSGPSERLSSGVFYFNYDRDANTIVALNPPPSTPLPWSTLPPTPNPGLVDLESIDAAGRSRWTLRLPASFNLGVAVAPSGEIWVADFEGARNEAERALQTGAIAVVSQDGSSCRRYSYEGIEMVNALEFSSDGQLWFLDHDRFGRFATPSP